MIRHVVPIVNRCLQDSIQHQATVIYVNLNVSEKGVEVQISENRKIEPEVTAYPELDIAKNNVEKSGGEMEYGINPEFGVSVRITMPVIIKKWMIPKLLIKRSAQLLESSENCEISFNINLYGKKYFFYRSDFVGEKGNLERHIRSIFE